MKSFVLCLICAAGLSAQLLPDADPKKVIATVNGKDVTVADFQLILQAVDPRYAQQMRLEPQRGLENYYIWLYLAQEAKKRKLDERSPMKEQIEFVIAQMLGQATLNDVHDSFEVSEDLINARYEKEKPHYEQAKVKIIYIPFQAAGAAPSAAPAATVKSPDEVQAVLKQQLQNAAAKTTRTEAEAETRAKEAVQKIRAGLDFSKAVEQYSENEESKAKGGDFGVIKTNGAYPADFIKAVLALKTGEVSDPIRQPNAFYVVLAEEKGYESLADLRPDLIKAVRDDQFNQYFKDLLAQFKATIKDPDYFVAAGMQRPTEAPKTPEAPKPVQ